MRAAIAAFATLLLAWMAAPGAIHAQGTFDVVVMVEEGPVRDALSMELSARGFLPRFDDAAVHPLARLRALDAHAGVWLDGSSVVAWCAARPGVARLRIAEREPRMVALLGAALVEELVTNTGIRPYQEATAPGPRPAASAQASTSEAPVTTRRVRVPYVIPELGPYVGVDPGAFITLTPFTYMAAVRASVGAQWRSGLRLGAVFTLEGDSRNDDGNSSLTMALSGGVEAGARLGDNRGTFHVGGQLLAGSPRAHFDRPPEQRPDINIIAGGYVGGGLWTGTRMELGLRLSGELWIEPDYGVTPVLRLSVRGEWR